MSLSRAARLFCVCIAACAAMLSAGCNDSGDGGNSSTGASGGPAGALPTVTTSTGIDMLLIPGGTFMMGSDHGGPDESPRHEVSVWPFAMDKYELTQDVYAKFEMPNPSQFKGPRRPVEQVRWSDAALFCNERSRREGLQPCYDETTFACNFDATGYRLPTEAEWEYAARAGDTGDYGAAGSPRKLASHACYAANSLKKTDPVGRKKPNAWGLCDMLGNVAEWCNDRYGPAYYAESPKQDPRGPAEGNKCVMRGGAWNSDEEGCRVSTRYAEIPGTTDACFARNSFGFRCVRRLTPDEAQRVRPATK
jgi:formylglycine-generating enzyme required for sulfatase activity